MPKHELKERMLKWATHLGVADNQKATELLEFLWKMDVLEAKSRYALVKYIIQWAYIEMKKNYPNYQAILNSIEK